MDLRRVRVWDWLTGLAGLVLLGSLFLDWYGSASGWEAFSFVDILLAVTAVGAVALLVAAATQRTAAVPQVMTALLISVVFVAAILTVFRLIDPPVDGDRAIGAWLGTTAVLALFFLDYRSMADRTFPHAMRPRLEVEVVPTPTPDGQRRDVPS